MPADQITLRLTIEDPVPAPGTLNLVGLVGGEAEQRLGTGVDLGELAARIDVGVARLHQRLVFQLGDAGKLDQTSESGCVGHAPA